MAYCPRCGAEVAINALSCLTCNALFGANSAWQPLVEPPQGRDFRRADRPTPGARVLLKIMFFLYLVFAVLCVTTAIANPPWRGGTGGSLEPLIGFLALMTAGLPWSLIPFFLPAMSDIVVSGANFGSIVINVCLLSWLAFRRNAP